MLQSLTSFWKQKLSLFINTINLAFETINNVNDVKIIKDMLSNGFDYLDKVFKSNKKLIIKFLGIIYPTESFNRKSDVSLLEYMSELADIYKIHYK